jgi:hypothetical protein
MISSAHLAARCRDDGEFRLAARHWTGGLRVTVGDEVLEVRVVDGVPNDEGIDDDDVGIISLAGPREVWDLVLAALPPRFYNDIAPASAFGIERTGSDVTFWQYYPAVARAVELLRAGSGVEHATPPRASAERFDSPVGRYVHLELDGHDHRVYIEEAGQGIPLLLQHTAGASSIQWRHLFEQPAITDHFRLIAYDLPFHGKSLPPTSRNGGRRSTASPATSCWPSREPSQPRWTSTDRSSWVARSADRPRSTSPVTTRATSERSSPSNRHSTSKPTSLPSRGSGTHRSTTR